MYVFNNSNNDLGKKASNIIKLNKYGYDIPRTYIIEFNTREKFEVNKLDRNKDYIIRPSFDIEDKKQKTYAGFFKSIGPIKKNKIKEVLKYSKGRFINKKDNFNYKLNSLIIQEFIKGDIYGVFFTRNPNSFFNEGGWELSQKSDGVTKGDGLKKNNLSFFQRKKIEFLGKRLEKDFNYPQDIEFVFKNGKIYLLQTRDISTGYSSIYDFDNLKKINGLYMHKNNGEFGSGCLVFVYSIIKKIYPNSLVLNNKIYFKIGFFSWLRIFLSKTKVKDEYLKSFISKYKLYLFFKVLYGVSRKLLFWIELDKEKLNELYGNYKYTFDLFKESNLSFDCKFSKTNLLTKFLLFIEKKKNKAFKEIYFFKKAILEKNEFGKNIKYLKLDELDNSIEVNKELINNRKNNLKSHNVTFDNKLFFIDGKIINNKSKNTKEFDWLYKGVIKGRIINNDQLNKNELNDNLNKILIIDSLNFNLYDVIDKIDGCIIKEGGKFSHNAIVLREHKIPSIINYNKFDKLNLNQDIFIKIE